MIIIYNIGGLLWGLAGLAAGIGGGALAGSPALGSVLTGILWIYVGRPSEDAESTPSLYFIPLFVWGIAALVLAVYLFFTH